MAAQKQQKYLIYNVTRLPVPAGRDTRTVKQRVGHAVQFRDKTDNIKVISAGGRPQLVDEVTPGMLALATPDENGEVHIRIRPIDDVMEALKDHAIPAREVAVRPQALAADDTKAPMENPPVPTDETPAQEGARQAHAVEMGKDVHTQRGGSEHEGAINPSGDPNFLVRAPAGPQHGRRGTKREAAVNAG